MHASALPAVGIASPDVTSSHDRPALTATTPSTATASPTPASSLTVAACRRRRPLTATARPRVLRTHVVRLSHLPATFDCRTPTLRPPASPPRPRPLASPAARVATYRIADRPTARPRLTPPPPSPTSAMPRVRRWYACARVSHSDYPGRYFCNIFAESSCQISVALLGLSSWVRGGGKSTSNKSSHFRARMAASGPEPAESARQAGSASHT